MKSRMTVMAYAIAIMMLVANQGMAEEKTNVAAQPTWDELTKLLGKKKDSAEFKAFVKTYQMESIGGPRGTDNFAPKGEGAFSIGTSAKGVVTMVGVQSGYPLALPHKLTWGMSAAAVKKLLGKPSKDFKGKVLSYKDKGLNLFIMKKGLDSVTKKLQ